MALTTVAILLIRHIHTGILFTTIILHFITHTDCILDLDQIILEADHTLTHQELLLL
jgi:hypothetical protein